MERKFRNTLIVVLINLIVSGVHGIAHGEIPVVLPPFEFSFVVIVILLCPIVAAFLVGLRHSVAGGFLLSLSMVGSFIFGIYYHFLAAGPDNIASVVADGPLGSLFRMTAILLVGAEIGGVIGGYAVVAAGKPPMSSHE